MKIPEIPYKFTDSEFEVALPTLRMQGSGRPYTPRFGSPGHLPDELNPRNVTVIHKPTGVQAESDNRTLSVKRNIELAKMMVKGRVEKIWKEHHEKAAKKQLEEGKDSGTA